LSTSQTNRVHQLGRRQTQSAVAIEGADQWPSKAARHVTPGGGVGGG